MKKLWDSPVPFLAYGVPYAYLGFWGKLVQEVVRMVLEAIYEGHFEDTSHGFRPHRSCHTALNAVQKTFTGKKWFIEGDIKGFFDNVNHNILIDILKERISDERFIRLIRKFLKAGYLEPVSYTHLTRSGFTSCFSDTTVSEGGESRFEESSGAATTDTSSVV